ncbi:nucleotide disphospho-sugar-binding domain-containing protein [Corallococcus sp. 4LFB]|uniref:nucleotide disphospho-sugar-binding domain-containing protein n=1 Tax=Corallococcus sp. 4LFB TaxID=3383249 RepID=UPI0039766D0B
MRLPGATQSAARLEFDRLGRRIGVTSRGGHRECGRIATHSLPIKWLERIPGTQVKNAFDDARRNAPLSCAIQETPHRRLQRLTMTLQDSPSILIAMSSSTGHVNGSLGVADRLRTAGYKVIYLGSSKIEATVVRQGFDFRYAPYLESIPVPFGFRHRPAWPTQGLFRYLSETRAKSTQARRDVQKLLQDLPEYSRQVDELIQDTRPSLLIFSPFVLLFYILFHKHGIPAATLSTKPLLDKDPLVPPYLAHHIPDDSVQSRARVEFEWLWCAAKYRLWEMYEQLMSGMSYRGLAAAMAKPCSFPIESEWATRPVLFDLKFRSLPELVLHARELDLPRKKPLSKQVHYLGPNVHIQRRDDTFAWEEIAPRGKLIYCSFSTVLHPKAIATHTRFFRELLRAMAGRPEDTLILSLGPALSREALSPIPGNVHVFPRVPQLEVLEKADLFITHGGSNSVKEAISVGVPMLVYPGRADQPGLSARVVRLGLGERGDVHLATAADIARLMDRVLGEPKYRAELAKAQDIVRAYDARNTTAETIRQLIASRQGPSPQAP